MSFKKLVLPLVFASVINPITADITIPTPQFTPTAKFKGFIQYDIGVTGFKEKDFGLRQARTEFLGSITKDIDYRVALESSSGTTTLLDGYATLKITPTKSLVIGKTKAPIGLELLQSPTEILFPEFGFTTFLVPNRDSGVQFVSKTDKAQVNLGLLSGATDFQSQDVERDRSRSIDGRVFLYPIRTETQLLGVGIGGNYESREGTTTSSALTTYEFRGYGKLFSYSSGVYANGSGYRIVPQAYYYNGRFGALTEYAVSAQEITKDANNTEVQNTAWQVAVQYMLSNDKATYGEVNPTSPFVPGKGLGAWQLGLRISEIKFDDDSFPIYASADQTSKAKELGVSLNWIWNKNLKWTASLERLERSNNNGKDSSENLGLIRAQIIF